jgi:hypothetical protein
MWTICMSCTLNCYVNYLYELYIKLLCELSVWAVYQIVMWTICMSCILNCYVNYLYELYIKLLCELSVWAVYQIVMWTICMSCISNCYVNYLYELYINWTFWFSACDQLLPLRTSTWWQTGWYYWSNNTIYKSGYLTTFF